MGTYPVVLQTLPSMVGYIVQGTAIWKGSSGSPLNSNIFYISAYDALKIPTAS